MLPTQQSPREVLLDVGISARTPICQKCSLQGPLQSAVDAWYEERSPILQHSAPAVQARHSRTGNVFMRALNLRVHSTCTCQETTLKPANV